MARELRPLVPAGFAAVVAGPGGGAPRWCRVGGRPARAGCSSSSSGCRPWPRCASRPSCSSPRRCSARSGSGSASRSWSRCATCPGEHGLGRDLLLAVLLGVWASDIAGFTIGRLFGRRLLAGRDLARKDGRGVRRRPRRRHRHRLLHPLPRAARPAAVDAPRARVRPRDRARRADRRPARELPQARHGREGHGPHPGRARRHARPRRRAAAGRPGGVLPGARHRQGMKQARPGVSRLAPCRQRS